MSGKRPKRAQPSLLDSYVTTIGADEAAPSARGRGYALIGCTPEGYPLFEAVKARPVPGQVVYETPLFEEFIPETFH